MIAIVATASDWAIGNKGELLFSIPTDMKHFRETTQNQVVIMGRKTLESFPGSKPLKNRVNIVLSRNKGHIIEGATVCNTAEEAIAEAEKYPDKKVYVIGGEQIYRLMLPYCDTAIVTRVDSTTEGDTYFPNLDTSGDWELADKSEDITENGHTYRFCTYKRRGI